MGEDGRSFAGGDEDRARLIVILTVNLDLLIEAVSRRGRATGRKTVRES
jgi:hypothetical protein